MDIQCTVITIMSMHKPKVYAKVGKGQDTVILITSKVICKCFLEPIILIYKQYISAGLECKLTTPSMNI